MEIDKLSFEMIENYLKEGKVLRIEFKHGLLDGKKRPHIVVKEKDEQDFKTGVRTVLESNIPIVVKK